MHHNMHFFVLPAHHQDIQKWHNAIALHLLDNPNSTISLLHINSDKWYKWLMSNIDITSEKSNCIMIESEAVGRRGTVAQ